VVAGFVALALGLVYGLGTLWFAWWDGGALRRALMLLCVLALAAAVLYAQKHHMIPKNHSTVTNRT
jgi:hypothetical protein